MDTLRMNKKCALRPMESHSAGWQWAKPRTLEIHSFHFISFMSTQSFPVIPLSVEPWRSIYGWFWPTFSLTMKHPCPLRGACVWKPLVTWGIPNFLMNLNFAEFLLDNGNLLNTEIGHAVSRPFSKQGGSESHSIHCPTKTVVWDCDIFEGRLEDVPVSFRHGKRLSQEPHHTVHSLEFKLMFTTFTMFMERSTIFTEVTSYDSTSMSPYYTYTISWRFLLGTMLTKNV